jgi:hypothetical protein
MRTDESKPVGDGPALTVPQTPRLDASFLKLWDGESERSSGLRDRFR